MKGFLGWTGTDEKSKKCLPEPIEDAKKNGYAIYMCSCINYLAILGDRYKGSSFNYFDKILAFFTYRDDICEELFNYCKKKDQILLTFSIPPTVPSLVNVVCEL